MKICLLAGADYVHARNWVNYFVGRGAKVYLISLEESIGTKGEEYILKSKIRYEFIKYPLSSFKISRLIKSIQPDIINAHFVPNYGLISTIIGYKPVVVTCLGSDVLESPKKDLFRKARISFVLRKADFIITDGKVLLKAVKRYNIAENRILNISFGVNTSLFMPGEREEACNHKYKVVNFRRLEKNCNPELFVKAIPYLSAKDNIKVYMLNRGAQASYIKNLIKKLKIDNIVELLPFLSESELAKLLGSTDIYVSTTFSDSTSVTLLEAMACGAFPIVTDIPGNREWIKNGKNGFLVSLNNHKELANKIMDAIAMPELRESARIKNREIVEKYGDRQKNMKLVENVFMKLISKQQLSK